MHLENLILKNLIVNDKYVKKVLPYLKKEYFPKKSEQYIFEKIYFYINSYNKSPSTQELLVELRNDRKIQQNDLNNCIDILNDINKDVMINHYDWMVDSTETFVKDRAIYLGMVESMQIIQNPKKANHRGDIVDILSKALSIGFDSNIGHNYLDDAEKQYEWYHKPSIRIPFDLQIFNEITNMGIPEKTLTVAMAGIHVGKSMLMCHFASGFMARGYNVLYISLEMGQEEVVRRIDANLMNIDMNLLNTLKKEDYLRKSQILKSKTNGSLIVKEYPTTTASATHFRSLLDEIWLKEQVRPDIIFVDYLNICASSRFRVGGAGMYEFVKGVAEELRGLAMEYNTRIFTATQVNRDGYKSSEPDMTNTAESFGLPATADFMFAMTANEQLRVLNQMQVIQLKNRFGDVNNKTKFLIGVDRIHQRFFDLSNPQSGLYVPKSNNSISIVKGHDYDKSKFANIKV